MGNFKLGDNINHNLRVLSLLYDYQSKCKADKKVLLCKPIIIILVSICEAVLYDLHMRLRTYTSEGVRNIAQNVIDYIRAKKIDEFGKYIASAQKHDFFDAEDSTFYEVLGSLRKLRNRIHIQNSKKHFELDEEEAFNHNRQIKAEKALEKVLKIMSAKYSRNEALTDYVADFELPWNEHF